MAAGKDAVDIGDLAAAVTAVALDTETRERYAHDDAEWADYMPPLAVVFAASVDDVVATVRFAADHGLAVIPRGAGTGLSGGANATAGSIVPSLERMTAIRSVDVEERLAVVEAGVLNDDLRRHVAEQGLWYPPDPASMAISTIGGNVATNAGGNCCVKYGCRASSGSPRHMTSSSPTSPTRGTATCTRSSSRRSATTPRKHARRPRSTKSSTDAGSSAEPSRASTGSVC